MKISLTISIYAHWDVVLRDVEVPVDFSETNFKPWWFANADSLMERAGYGKWWRENKDKQLRMATQN